MATHEDIIVTQPGREAYIDVLIDQSEDDDLSGSADLQDWNLIGIVMPAAITATNITFQGSVDDSTFGPIDTKADAAYTVTSPDASDYVMLPLTDTMSFPRFLKVATSANQAADRTIRLVLRK